MKSEFKQKKSNFGKKKSSKPQKKKYWINLFFNFRMLSFGEFMLKLTRRKIEMILMKT